MRNPQRLPLLALALLLLPSCQPGSSAEPGPIREIDSRVQLFVDDHLVADSDRVWRSLTGAYNTRPRKVAENPIIKPDRPWEGYLVLQPGSAIYDEEEQVFKLWYNTFGNSRNTDVREFLCYATSKDGIHWEKPELGIVEFRGSKANNIVLDWVSWNHVVLKEPDDPDPNRRYKMAYWQHHDRPRHGIWVAFSPDGLNWTDYENNPVVPIWGSGDTFGLMRDPGTKQYWLYHKTSPGGPRKVSRLVSDDFIHWRDSRFVLEPDEMDPPHTEFYGVSAFPYGSHYLGLIWVFHTDIQTMDAQLASSVDGVNWERSVYRRPFMVLGYQVNGYGGSSFDSGMVFPISTPVVHDGEVWIYYSGFDNLHNAPAADHKGQIGLMKIRQDGWAALDATAEGHVTTHPLRFEGSTLRVNVELLAGGKGGADAPWKDIFNDDPDNNGYLRVELQDQNGKTIPGYGAAESKLSEEEGVYRTVSWEGGNLSGVTGPVRLKFVYSRARLYSFQIN